MTAPPFAENDAVAGEFFLRMLFSCLVDVDFLDTEAHFDEQKSTRREATLDAHLLLTKLRVHQAQISMGRDDALTSLRRRVAAGCEAAGDSAPGIYRMTVPTGGGKTLAGMGFALRHAAAHGKRRVVVAIPYTSITEQTARVYRDVFGGNGVVLEHHSAADPREDDDGAPTADHSWQRLAAETWDAPIVVTTTVQLFESLFGRRVSRSRKLHNLANSVLILDEVQMLPPGYREPILDGLHRLASDYGATILLSTATQPQFSAEAFRARPDPPGEEPQAVASVAPSPIERKGSQRVLPRRRMFAARNRDSNSGPTRSTGLIFARTLNAAPRRFLSYRTGSVDTPARVYG